MIAPVDQGRRLRDVAGKFATGVTVVTTQDGDQPSGMTVNSFASVSLDPQLVMFCANRASNTGKAIERNGHFAVNVLAADQQEIAARFAKPGADRFKDLPVHAGATGSPIIDGCIAFMDCRVTQVVPAGDHDIIVGHVESMDADTTNKAPLIFQAGHYLSGPVKSS